MSIDDTKFGSKDSFRLFPDPHGQAALLLVESLIHVLRERSILTTSQAIDVVTTALDVQADVAEAADGAGEKMWQSYALLSDIAESLNKELPRTDGAEVQL